MHLWKTKMMMGGFLLGVVCTGHLSAQPHDERPNPALDQLRSGVWGHGGFDSSEPARRAGGDVRLIPAGWDPPQLTPPQVNLVPGPEAPRAPTPREVKPVDAVRTIEPARAVAVATGACNELRRKARSLRSAALQCDVDVANGRPYCNVRVDFDVPAIPRLLNAQGARGYAEQFESVALRGSERLCSEFGGPGYDPADEPSRVRADEHYQRLCSAGDHYACNARQIEQLCFDTSPMNSCVRDCLVTRDELCLSGESSRLPQCRVRSHFQCYAACGKLAPSIPEGFCFTQLPGWRSFQ